MNIQSLHKNLVAYYKLNGNGINEVDPTDSIQLVGSTNSFNGAGFNASCYNNNGSTLYATGKSTKKFDLSNEFTMSCWFKSNSSVNDYCGLFGNYASNYDPSITNSRHNFNIFLDPNNGLKCFFNHPDASNFVTDLFVPNSSLYYTRWNQVTFSYNKQTSTIKYYFNGTYIKSSSLSYIPAMTLSKLIIGSFADNWTGLTYNGRIQNFKVWNRVLSDEEILYDHQSINTENLDNNMLLAHLPLNGSGEDITGNGYDLTLFGTENSFNGEGINSSCYNYTPSDITRLSDNIKANTTKEILLDHDQTWMCWAMPKDPSLLWGYNAANEYNPSKTWRKGILTNISYKDPDPSLRMNFACTFAGESIQLDGGNNTIDTSTGQNRVIYSTVRNMSIFNQWTHIAYSYNKQQNKLNVYINGKLEDSSILTSTPMFKESTFTIGSWAKNFNEYVLMGKIQDVKIYARTLEDYEIKKEYDSINGDNIQNGLVAWYRSNEGGKDLTGNGYDLSIDIPQYANFDGEGIIGKCFESKFDINNRKNRAISNRQLYLNNEQTWSCWLYINNNIKPAGDNVGSSFMGNSQLGKYFPMSKDNFSFAIMTPQVASSRILIDFKDINNGIVYSYTKQNVITEKEWVHYTFTHKNKEIKQYINGKLVETYTDIRNYGIKFSPEKIILGNYANYYYVLDGKLDDVRIYNRVLSDQEIYNLSKAKILHYKFDQPVEMTNNLFPDPYCTTMHLPNNNTVWQKNYYTTNNDVSVAITQRQESGYKYANIRSEFLKDTSRNYMWSYVNYKLPTLTPYIPYTLSFDIRVNELTDASSGISLRFSRYFNDFRPGLVSFFINALGPSPVIYKDWQKVTLTRYFEPSSLHYDNSTYVTTVPYFEIFTSLGRQGTIIDYDIKNVQLEQCSVATTFNPSNNYDNLYTIRDYSGYNHDASIVSYACPQWKYDNSVGGTYKFNCVNNNGRTAFPYSDINSGSFIVNKTLKQFPNNDTFSFNYWTKSNGTGFQYGTNFAFLSDINEKNGFSIGSGLDIRDGNISIRNVSSDEITRNYFDFNSGNSWQMNTIIFNRKDPSMLKVYINGQIKYACGYYNLNASTGLLLDPSYNKILSIGWISAGSIDRFFTGSMADFRMYATALDQSDILRLYNTQGSLDNTGNLYCYNVEETGYKPSLIDYSNWNIDYTIPDNYTSLTSIKNNTIIRDYNPWNKYDAMWRVSNKSLIKDQYNRIGGFSTNDVKINNTKKYRFSVWSKRDASQTDGEFYMGPLSSTLGASTNILIDLSTNTIVDNPYSILYSINENKNTFLNNQWVLNVFYIQPYFYLSSIGDPCTGVYNTKDGNITSLIDFTLLKDYKFSDKSIYNKLRSFYIKESYLNSNQLLYRPRIDLCDGTEPSIDDLLYGSEHIELFNQYKEASTYIKPSLVDYSMWTTDQYFMEKVYTNWVPNGGWAKNKIILDYNPWSERDILWSSVLNDVSLGPDGGFYAPYTTIDTNNKYRYSVWIKRRSTDKNYNGFLHFGPGTSESQALYGLEKKQLETNPYFVAFTIDNSININLQEEWILFVFYLWPISYDENLGTDASSGMYILRDNKYVNIRDEIIYITHEKYSDYKFVQDIKYNMMRLRTFFYYSNVPTEYQYFYRPRIDICDGTEPSIDDLLSGIENPNALNSTFINSINPRIEGNGKLLTSEIIEDSLLDPSIKMRMNKYNIQLSNKINELNLNG